MVIGMVGESDTPWRWLPYQIAPATDQLAAAEALLAGLAQHTCPALRWYTTPIPALVLGTGQQPDAADRAACAAAGISIHRRSSGGTAVLMTAEFVMLDIVLPTSHPFYISDVTKSYRWLGNVWVAALDLLGLSAQILPIAEARADAQALDHLTRRACFGGRSPYEVLVSGRKLVGFSQVRRRQGALLQAGLYTTWSPRQLPDLLALTPDERALLTERLAKRVTSLADRLTPPPDPPMIMAAFATALQRLHGITLEPAQWSTAEQAARIQATARFAPYAYNQNMDRQ